MESEDDIRPLLNTDAIESGDSDTDFAANILRHGIQKLNIDPDFEEV